MAESTVGNLNRIKKTGENPSLAPIDLPDNKSGKGCGDCANFREQG